MKRLLCLGLAMSRNDACQIPSGTRSVASSPREMVEKFSWVLEPTRRTFGMCRGPESNWLRPPFQGTRRQILSLAKSVI
jgi:hypothetical protein